MPFNTIKAFKNEVTTLLSSYCKYILLKPKRYVEAKALEEKLKSCETKKAILEALNTSYCDLLGKASKDSLVKKIALVMAKELDVKENDVNVYHAHRENAMQMLNLEDIRTIPAYYAYNAMGFPCKSFKQIENPVLAAYDKTKAESTEIKKETKLGPA